MSVTRRSADTRASMSVTASIGEIFPSVRVGPRTSHMVIELVVEIGKVLALALTWKASDGAAASVVNGGPQRNVLWWMCLFWLRGSTGRWLRIITRRRWVIGKNPRVERAVIHGSQLDIGQ